MEDKKTRAKKAQRTADAVSEKIVSKDPYVGFLKNETVLVQYIPKPTKEITNPSHVAYGGKLQGTFDNISPPRLDKGRMQNILTNEEKEGLEYLMSRDLSIYGDFWKSYRKGGMFPIALSKDDVVLNLMVPEDYITWKVLKNTQLVANSTDQLKNEFRASYKYVMVKEHEGAQVEEDRINDKAEAFAFYSELSNSPDGLRYILRVLGKHTHSGQDLSFLRKEVGKQIDSEPSRKIILKLKSDKLFKEKILLEEAFGLGVIDRISGQYFTKENEPISGTGEDPNEHNAARFLGSPVGQDMKLAIEARVKNARN
tara:strand:- start:12344 stop:13279 length:936 start_codon:yes stop_codon:yes gene_type:complete